MRIDIHESFLALIVIIASFNQRIDAAKPLSPVILIPGLACSQLEAKLDKPSVVHSWCTRKTDGFFSLWLNLDELFPLFPLFCFADNIRLRYDNETRRTHNAPGVQIRVPGWGTSEVVEWLDPSSFPLTGVFSSIVKRLVAEAGYVRNRSIRGAPYDFRKGPNESARWCAQLKTLIEQTYRSNGGQPVTLIAHSLGAPMTMIFMHQRSAAWKTKFIARIISLSGVYGGAVRAIQSQAIGADSEFPTPSFVTRRVRHFERTFTSLAFLVPSRSFWRTDEVLVRTQQKNYTIADLPEFYDDLQFPMGWQMYTDQLPYQALHAPGVELHCLFGIDIPTIAQLDYSESSGGFPNGTPRLVNGPGDGVVNTRSLRGCSQLPMSASDAGEKSITVRTFSGVTHQQILGDDRVIQYIVDTLMG